MTYYGAKELASSFRTVRNNTIKIAEEIPENKYGFRPAEGCRSVAETLVHIAETNAPPAKAQILELLRTEGERYAKALEGVSETFLGEQVAYPEGMEPPMKSRFEMLIAAKEHEMHHRGQLMLVQRLLGIKPHLTRQMEERIATMQAGR